MANIFGKECWDLAGKMYDELFPINQPTDINNVVHNTLPEMIDENIVANVVGSFESEHIPVVIAINDQENMQNFDQTRLETPGDSNNGNVIGNRIMQNSHNSVDLFLEIPIYHNPALLMSTSLPPTPVSIASTSSSPQTIRNRKQIRKCCKAMKAWLIEQPRNLQKAQNIFSQYPTEINDSLNMRTPRSGRPRFVESRGALNAEQLNYFRSNYAVINRCKLFIASFVKMYNNGFAKTITFGDLDYPFEIENPSLRNRHHTQ
uniref:Uncharacterized protein n=1 Tax=Panagrolaimus sp. PS1159 TaxID=55785 RepID=A0AC35GC52_9BILA